MSRTNQTEAALLGALSVQPMTGYAVREAIRDVLGHFWNESFGQIYPTLGELERQGCVHRDRSGSTRSSTFALTERGQMRLQELLAQPVQPTPPRDGLLLRLFFGRHLGPQECRRLVKQASSDAECRLAEYEAIRSEIRAAPDRIDDIPYRLLTISAGEHRARAVSAWAKESLAALEKLHPSTGAPES